ncbi:MAG: nicotinamide mononucleotide transporter [Clostridia bacterium]|nr:nicotinamide mononucleotide transporter [Clostridia bacterium]
MKLTKFEKCLWIVSVIVVTGSFFAFKSTDYLTLIASLIGVTSLIFLAKGHAIGQILIIIFSVFYGIISMKVKYYGEMITYLGMTTPMAIVALISWIRHQFKDTNEVEINRMTKKQTAVMLTLTAVTTIIFYFILKKLGNASLFFSTVSIATSFLASYLTAMRSPYYALGYAANDLVLIVLWIISSTQNISSVSMVACFVMFLFNDLYGFINWKKMEQRQNTH